jgi:YebC/PmpR family DNA-binding regulatory protein
MSGHSKWSKIKRKKGANDAKRGALFTKLAKAITIAASEGGSDPVMNFVLRLSIDSAKKANMPLNNIERAVKKGSGELEGGKIMRTVYEGIGPSGSSFIVRCSTDNTNRTISELRKIFDNAGGTIGASGSQMWQFEEKGVLVLQSMRLLKSDKFGKEDEFVSVDQDELEMSLMEVVGIEDIRRTEDDYFEIYTSRNDFAEVHKVIDSMGIKIDEAELKFIPKDRISPTEEVISKVLTLMENLDDHDDVDGVFTNIDV